MRHGNPAFIQQPLGPMCDYMAALEKVVDTVEISFDFPAYCFDDPIFADPEYPVAIQCENEQTHGPFHVVLISSIDGISWWVWIVEAKRFEVMEFQWED
tara:strand:- start:2796 stop:3092 length:297 start_codon:yes stop_codon:yes gene_type:complete